MAKLADINKSAQLLLIAGGVGLAGLAVYYVYQWYQNNVAGSSVDPATGQSNGVINNLDAYLFPIKPPGGGEVAGSSETYTGALSTVISDPWGSFKSIFGIQ